MKKSLSKLVLVTIFCLGGRVLGTDVGGLICTNTTWTSAGSPYVITGSSIVVGCNATLTIEPGVVVKVSPTLAITVGSTAFGKGNIIARGTEQLPIVFTSTNAPAAPGNWSRIHFTDFAVDATFDSDGNYLSGGILEHVIVEYAGYGNYAAVFAEKSAPFLNYCEIRHNLLEGVKVTGTNAPAVKISNCQVWDNAKRGIYITDREGYKLLNNNIHDNHDGGIYLTSSTNNTVIGNTISGNTTSDNGGGIYFYSSSGVNILTGNTISGNTAGWGGGICFYSSCGGNTLIENTISSNTANSGGGGIYFISSGTNTLTENTISSNTTNNDGGGIYFNSSGSNTLTENTISSNTANNNSGGIYFYYGGSNTLTGNNINGNTASRYDGGGIDFYYYSGTNKLTGNNINDNTASRDAGGIFFYYSGTNTLTGNTINGNTTSEKGSGIYFNNSSNNKISTNAIQGNTSRNGSGAIYFNSSTDTPLYRNTITDNYITSGTTGGIYVTGNSERISLAGNPDDDTYNIICWNDGYQVYNNNGFNADGRNDINAVYVQWGTSDILLIMEKIFDYFDDGSKAFVMFYPFVCPGDFDLDEDVDLLDLKTFVDNWLRQDCTIPDWCEGTDLDLSTNVDFVDFAYFAENWLFGVGP